MVAIGRVELQGDFGSITKQFKILEKEFIDLTAAATRFAAKADFDPASREFQALQKRIVEVRKEMDLLAARAGRGLNELVKAQVITAKEAENLAKVFARQGKEADKARQAQRKLSDTYSTTNKNTKNLQVSTGLLAKAQEFLSKTAVRALQIFLGYQAIRITRETIRSFAEFQRSIATLGIVAGATENQLKALTDQASDLARQTKFTTSEVVNAQVELSRAGLKTNEILATTEAVLNTATVAQIDAARASEILISTINQFGLEAKDANEVADILTATTLNSAQGMEQLAEAMKLAGPTAANLGLSLKETATLIGTLADNGINATIAGTQIRTVLLSLAKITPNAAAAFKKLGVEINETTLANGGFVRILEDLAAAGVGTSTKLENLGAVTQAFGKRGTNAISTLAREINRAGGSFERLGKNLENVDGLTKKVADSIQDNLAGSFDRLKSTFESVAFANIEEGGIGRFFKFILDSTTDLIIAFDDGIKLADAFGKGVSESLASGATQVEAFAAGFQGLRNRLAPEFSAINDQFLEQLRTLNELQMRGYHPTVEEVENVGRAFRDLVLNIPTKEWKDHEEVLITAADAVRGVTNTYGDLAPPIQDALERVEEFFDLNKDGGPILDSAIGRLDKYTKEFNELAGGIQDASIILEDRTTAFLFLADRLEDTGQATDDVRKKVAQMAQDLAQEFRKLGEDVPTQLQIIIDSYAEVSAGTQDLLDEIRGIGAGLEEQAADIASAWTIVVEQFGESSVQATALANKAFELGEAFEAAGKTAPDAIKEIAKNSESFAKETEKSFKAAQKEIEETEKVILSLEKTTRGILKDLRDEFKKFQEDVNATKVNPEFEAASGTLAELVARQDELNEKTSLSLEEQEEINELSGKISDARSALVGIEEEIADEKTRQVAQEKLQEGLSKSAVATSEKLRAAAAKISDEYSEQANRLLEQAEILERNAESGVANARGILDANTELERVTEQIRRDQEAAAAAQKRAAEEAKKTKGDLEKAGEAAGEAADKTGKAADATKNLADESERAADAQRDISESAKAFGDSVSGVESYNDKLRVTLDLLQQIKACLNEINQ